jgi:hypothetical protein
MRKFLVFNLSLFIWSLLLSGLALCVTPSLSAQDADQSSIEGTVASASRETLVVRTDDGNFYLFVFDRYTTKPRIIATGSRVRVLSTLSEQEGTRLATNIAELQAGPATTTPSPGTQAKPLPPAVRDLEQGIKSEARRWHLGVRAGAALDPELFLFGVHSQLGPVFNRNVFFRPNAEFAFGEITDMIALNLEAIYRLPITARGRRLSAYVGAGPALNFVHQDFQRQLGEGRDIDFGNFDYETGFNILAGIQRRHTFFEVKTSLWSEPAPTLRLMIGYTF